MHKNKMFPLRIPTEKIEKIKYIAEYSGRSANKEIEMLITKSIKQFEEKQGKIIISEE